MGKLNFVLVLAPLLLTSPIRPPVPPAATLNHPVTGRLASPEYNDDLLLYLPFSGSTADSSQYHNTVRAFGNVRFSDPKKEAGVAEFRADEMTRLEVDGKVLEDLDEYSIVVRFKPYDDRPMVLLSRTQYAACANMHQGFSIMTGYEGTGTRFLTKKGGHCDDIYTATAFGTAVTSTEAPVPNEWNTLLVTFSRNRATTYLNGARVASGKEEGGSLCHGAPLQVGSWWEGEPYFFNGCLDEIRVYKHAFSNDEIRDALRRPEPVADCSTGLSY